jgi:hypothetical protein
MSNTNKCLISQDNGKLQIPYEEYKALMEKVQEGQRLQQIKTTVIANLKKFLGGENQVAAIAEVVEAVKSVQAAAPKAAPVVPEPEPVAEKVSVEFDAQEPAAESSVPVEAVKKENKPAPKAGRKMDENANIPPIKKDISVHFNKLDESGRLFSVFKQYYTCLNDTCGGTVRVTMKDGFCSLWNYDEWEEFAFIDLFEGHLRVSVDPRYTSELESLSFCEVPRLLSSRRSLVSVQVDDLSNTMLDLLVKAFEEVGLTAN